MQTKQEEAEAARKELVTVKEELGRSGLRVSRLEGELRANQEAVMQRQVMRDKLERFSDLERENTSLRNRNTLLVETAANTALLREQVDQQRAELGKLEDRVREVDRLRAELGVAREEVREWGQVVVSKKCSEKREEENDLDKEVVNVQSGLEQDKVGYGEKEVNDVKEKKVPEGDTMKMKKSCKTSEMVDIKLVEEEVVVRKVEALYMIFNNGSVVRGIEREAGARLDLDHQKTSSNFTRVRVRGRREEVEAAKALMARVGRNTLQAPVAGWEADTELPPRSVDQLGNF